jgi:transmembrane sensor
MLSDQLTQGYTALDAVSKAAIEWEVKLRDSEMTVSDRSQFDAWLRANPSHEDAWVRLQSRLGRLSPLKDAPASAVSKALREPSHARRRILKAGAGAAVGILAGIGTRELVSHYSPSADYRNENVAPEKLALNNGVPLTLGASTRLYRTDQHHSEGFYLASGQIATGVAGGMAPSLQVSTRDGTVRARGAQLSVDALQLHTVVAIQGGDAILSVRGGSAVKAPDGSAWALAKGRAIRMPETSDDIFSWTRGTLVVLDRAVPDVVETLGRYFHGYIRFPESAMSRRVSGVFPLSDVEAALRQLAEGLGLSLGVYGKVLAVASDR